MSTRKILRAGGLGAAVLTITTVLLCCRAPQQRGPDREPAPQPAEVPPAAVEPPPTAAKPAEPPPPEKPRQEKPRPPRLPDYLALLDRFETDEGFTLNVELTPPNRLAIDTRNVQRLRIDRDRLPLSQDRSVVLQLDGQGFEWTAGSDVSVFERSANGVWRGMHDSERQGSP
jgi:hypothetical protein